MKIVVLDGFTENPGDLSWDGLGKYGDWVVYDRTSPAQVIERIGDAEIVFTSNTPLSQEMINRCANLKYIGVLATGYDMVDVAAAEQRGIVVTNIPTYGTAAVAQFVFALLLEICDHVGHHNEAVHQGRWTTCPDFCFWDTPLIELSGKTMGIIGFGRIGQAAAVLARAFGMEILAFDEHPSESGKRLASYVSLDELFKRSDVISLHCPLLPSTAGMINQSTLSKMKDGVILINTARGQLVVEPDLRDALESGKVSYAAVDVVSCEPIQADNPLLSAKNCIITPHIAWASKESRQRLMDFALENLGKYLQGTPVNVVRSL